MGDSRVETVIPFEQGWDVVKREGIDKALRRLQTKDDNPMPKEEISRLYSMVYQMCTQPTPNNWSGKLYYTVLDELREICEKVICKRIVGKEGKVLLESLIEEWEKYKKLIKCFRAILGYLDRFYVKRLALLDLNDVGVKAFHDFIFENNKIALTSAFIDMVEQDRRGTCTCQDHVILRQVTDIYVTLGQKSLDVYENDLQEPLLQASERYMKKEAAKWLAQSTCSQYLNKVRSQLNAEGQRAELYLHMDSRDPLLKVCEKQLISSHLETILNMENSGCKWLLQNDKTESLNLMFILLRRVPNGLAPMGQIFRKFLQEIGADLLANPRYENQWNHVLDDTLINSIVLMNLKYRKMLKECFAEHNTFHRALKEAFEYFMNLPLPAEEPAVESENAAAVVHEGKQKAKRKRNRKVEITISELLSDYIDRKLRKPPTDMIPFSPAPTDQVDGLRMALTPRHESSLEMQLVQIVEVFSYVNEKDVFAQFYKKHLAKRLILGRSTSLDAEQVAIQRLQLIGGNPFVSKFTGMIKDLMLACSLQNDFIQNVREKKKSENSSFDPVLPFGYDVRVKILTSGFWPTYKEEPLKILPVQMQQVVDAFQTFYSSRTAHRTLTWVHTLSSMVITSTFENSRRVDVHLNTFQGALLMLFNQNASCSPVERRLSLEEISTQLGISKASVTKHLYSMVKGKNKIILEHANDNSEEGPAERTYSVNWKFECKARKIRIPLLAAEKKAEAAEDRETNLLKISEERRYAVEATIVRIMKAQKKLRYTELSQKVVETLGYLFQAQPKTIRKRVDDLVERDYLEVDSDDENILIYVA